MAAYFNGDKLALHYLTADFRNVLRVWTSENDSKLVLEKNFEDDFEGGFGYFSTGFSAGQNSTKVFFGGSSMTAPNNTYELDLDALSVTKLANAAEVHFDKAQVKTGLVFFKSLDGKVSVPMFIFSNKKQNVKPKFAYIFFYGAIGTPQSPWWNKKLQIALEMGAVVAVPFIRGGGELGRSWTRYGEVDRMTTISDIAAASRYVRAHFNLSSEEVVISSRSLGGMHVLGAMAHFNDDFGVYIPTVAISDPELWVQRGLFAQYATDDFGLRRATNGNLIDPYGDLQKNRKWSPLKNIDKIKSMKPTFFFTAQNDERVSPVNSYLMYDLLKKKFGAESPLYLFSEPKAGHLARTEYVDELSFIAQQFGIEHLQKLVK